MLRSFAGKFLRGIDRVSPRAHDWFWDSYFLRRHRRARDSFRWRRIAPCLERKVECAGAIVGGELFVFGGFRSLDQTSGLIEIFDLANERWKPPIPFRAGLPHTHQGVASDGKRFVYLAGGQVGPQSSPCVADVSVFDAQTRDWSSLPPLPEPRYAPVARILNGRLHIVAGAKPDRFTHAADHWSLAIAEGRALEKSWRPEAPIPRGGHHRASAVIGDRLFTFGGQERDVRPIVGDPHFTCDWSTPEEIIYGDVFCYSAETARWTTLAPMPLTASHTEFSIFTSGRLIATVGGLATRMSLRSEIQVFDTDANRWMIAGRLPYPLKGHVAFVHEGTVYVFAGQRGTGATSSKPGAVLRSGWKARLPDMEKLFLARAANERG